MKLSTGFRLFEFIFQQVTKIIGEIGTKWSSWYVGQWNWQGIRISTQYLTVVRSEKPLNQHLNHDNISIKTN